MKLILLVAVVAFIQPCLGIDPVPALNITRYIGRWYQMYADLIVVQTSEKDCVCTAADYTLRKDGKIGVFNSYRLKTPTGPPGNITGYAYTPDPKEPGKLKVHFDVSPVDGDYWVVSLGPPIYGEEEQYEYSVVTDRLKLMLYVLARDPVVFNKKYNEEVLEFLKSHGFTLPYNKPIPINQSMDCKYAPHRNLYQSVDDLFTNY